MNDLPLFLLEETLKIVAAQFSRVKIVSNALLSFLDGMKKPKGARQKTYIEQKRKLVEKANRMLKCVQNLEIFSIQ